jgi:hypothetical protein
MFEYKTETKRDIFVRFKRHKLYLDLNQVSLIEFVPPQDGYDETQMFISFNGVERRNGPYVLSSEEYVRLDKFLSDGK